MKTKKINGLQLEKMLRNGLANLGRHRQELNSLNVFPVADGDTGSNMYATLESGLAAAKGTTAVGAYLKPLTEAMLYGARGNSGVILSQLFRGIFTALSHRGSLGPQELKNAFISAYKTAYAAVVRPVEGTILTVAREGIEHIRNQLDRGSCLEDLLSLYAAEMRKSLAHTPELLPVLKEADVVDSGALGYILIVEGMLMYLYGDLIEGPASRAETPVHTEGAELDPALFNENTIFDKGYCMEFVLQLMAGEKYSRRFHLDRYIDGLQDYGSSIVAVQNNRRVKVHVHTFKPGKIFAFSQEFGELVTCKIDNMQLQHNMVLQKEAPAGNRVPFAVVAVVDHEPMQKAFREMGCACALAGGTTMNVSVQDMIDAVERVNAGKVVILPNNGNLIRTADQAKSLCGTCEITVLETRSIAEGYCALQMDVADSQDHAFRIRQMQLGMESVVTFAVTSSSRNYAIDGEDCPAGTPIAVSGDRVLCRGGDSLEAFCGGLDILFAGEGGETCLVFRGEREPEEACQALEDRIRARYPFLELVFLYGGSQLYNWTAALM